MNEPVAVTDTTDSTPIPAEPAATTVAEMIASNDATASDPPAAVVASDVGGLLRAAREKMGLSANDVAAKLRMGLKQVQALEASNYEALPKGTFLRGFVRNYARQVSLNGDEVIALLEKTHSDALLISATPEVQPAQQNIRVQRPGGELATPKARALGALAFTLILAAVAWYWWEFMRPGRPAPAVGQPVAQTMPVSQPSISPSSSLPNPVAVTEAAAAPPTVSGGEAKPAPTQTTPVPGVTAVAAPQVTSQPASATAPKAVVDNVPPVAAKPAAPAVPAGASTLGFTFTGESWVEVTDVNGKILVSKRFKAGDAEEIFGRGPLSVVIGNAQATRMASNGREFDLVPHTRVSVARVTVK